MSYTPYPNGNTQDGIIPPEGSGYYGATENDGSNHQNGFDESNFTPYAQSAQMPQHSGQDSYVNPTQFPIGTAPLYSGPAPYFDPYAKSRLVAGLLGIILGIFGAHRFYLGYVAVGVVQIVVVLVTFGIGIIWPIVEGLMILADSASFQTDAQGRLLRP